MFTSNSFFGIIILFLIGVGIPTNLFLLLLYSFSFFSGYRMKPVNLIFTQMTFFNIMSYLKGGLDIIIVLGNWNFLNDVGCKLVFYIQRLVVALSICITSYLCTFQAITISSNVSSLGKLKVWFLDHIFHCCFFFWIFNLLLEMPVLFCLTGPRPMNNITYVFNFGHCSIERHMDFYWTSVTIRNVFCVVLIVYASCYIVFLLYRHHQKVQTIHKNNLLVRTSPEVRATQTILLLVTTFVFFYSVTSISTICMNYFYQQRFWLMFVHTILSLCFPTLSPFILMPWGSKISLHFQARKSILLNSNPSAT